MFRVAPHNEMLQLVQGMAAKAAVYFSAFRFCCMALIQFCCTTVLFLFTVQIGGTRFYILYIIFGTPLVFS